MPTGAAAADGEPVVLAAVAGLTLDDTTSEQGLAILAGGSPSSRPADCASGTPTGAPAQTANPGSSTLQYDPLSGQYVYVWKTEKAWVGTCRLLDVTVDDSTSHTALFQFKS